MPEFSCAFVAQHKPFALPCNSRKRKPLCYAPLLTHIWDLGTARSGLQDRMVWSSRHPVGYEVAVCSTEKSLVGLARFCHASQTFLL